MNSTVNSTVVAVWLNRIAYLVMLVYGIMSEDTMVCIKYLLLAIILQLIFMHQSFKRAQ